MSQDSIIPEKHPLMARPEYRVYVIADGQLEVRDGNTFDECVSFINGARAFTKTIEFCIEHCFSVLRETEGYNDAFTAFVKAHDSSVPRSAEATSKYDFSNVPSTQQMIRDIAVYILDHLRRDGIINANITRKTRDRIHALIALCILTLELLPTEGTAIVLSNYEEF